MKILIIGTGIIGTIYGWALAQAKHEVTHLVRVGKAKELATGIPLDMLDNRKGYPKSFIGNYIVRATESLFASDNYELVIVPTKPYQLEEALRVVVPNTPRADYLLLTQNWEGTARIDAVLPRARYIYGDAQAGGAFDGNTLVAALIPTIHLGQVDGGRGPVLEKISALFANIGIKPNVPDNILHFIWVQYAINAGLWTGVVRAGGLDQVLRDAQTGKRSLQAVDECLQVVAKRGVDLDKYPDAQIYRNPNWFKTQIAGMMMTLMFRFNKTVQRTSAHALGDAREITTAYYDLLKSGEQLGVAMPVMKSFDADIQKFANK